MSVMSVLEGAQGGQLFRKLGELAGLAPSDARKALEAFCPSIAARLRDRARDRSAYEQLLELLEDNESDLIETGHLSDEDVRDDGRAILADIYGSQEQAREEALATARALRIDNAAAELLHPIAASLVLCVLSRRYREEESQGKVGKAEEGDPQEGTRPDGRKSPGILSILLAAIGGAIMRALVNRLMPRRRRRRSYSYTGTQKRPRRRALRREPRLEDLFRDLIR